MNYRSTKQLLLKCRVTNPSDILKDAIAEDSNLASDWLWYAQQVENDAERRYCFERILYINPNDRGAVDALRILNNKEAMRNSRATSTPLGWLYRVWMRFSL